MKNKLVFFTFLSMIVMNSIKANKLFPDDDPYKNNNLNKPVIGIVTNPLPINGDDQTTKSTINYPYVNWIEDFGFNSLPLYWNYSDAELENIIPKLNGVLYQGGDRNFIKNGKLETQFAKIINLANKYKIPIWFTCQGLEFLHFMLADSDIKILSKFDAREINLPISLNADTIKTSVMFKYFQTEDFEKITDKNDPATIHYHNFGITPEDFYKNKKISSSLSITSVAKDNNGKVFVNSVESKDFNESKMFAVQFHPEKANYNVDEEYTKRNSNDNTIVISQKIAYGFAEEVFKSRASHSMSKDEQKKYGVFSVIDTAVNYNNTGYLYDYKPEVKFLMN